MAKQHYSKQIAAKVAIGKARTIELTCLTDGGTMEFVDEGPFPIEDGKPVDGWRQRDPSGRRQHLLKQLRKRTAVEVDGAGEADYSVWAHAFRDARGVITPCFLNSDTKAGPIGLCVRNVDDKGKVTLTRVEPPKPVWEQAFQMDFPIPLADEAWCAAHKVLLGNRAKIAERGALDVQRAIKVEEEKRIKAPAMPATEVG